MDLVIFMRYLFIVFIIIVIIGVFGNILNIVALREKSFYETPTFKLLFYLSIIDLLILLICASDPIMDYVIDFKIRHDSMISCKLHVFLTYFLSHLSSILLAIVSIERTFLIYNFKLKIFQIKFITKLFLIVTLIIGLINIHYFIFFTLNYEQPVQYLTPKNFDEQFSPKTNVTINSVVIQATNFIEKMKKVRKPYHKNISFGSNIVKNGFQRVLKRNRYLEVNTTNGTKVVYHKPFLICYPHRNKQYSFFLNRIWNWIDDTIYSFLPTIIMIICSIAIITELRKKTKRFRSRKHSVSNNAHMRQNRRNKQILAMLATTNFFFILCSFPYSLTNNNIFPFEAHHLLIVHLMAYSNNSFNFIFFAIFSTKYR